MAFALSFEQAPPISVPYRFFVTAPLFGVAAGLFVVWQGGEVFETRGTFPALALTHLITLGFMMQVMCGALLQVSPVAAGANVWCPRCVAWIGHAGLAAGSIALASGLAMEHTGLLRIAAPVLIGAMAFYSLVVLIALMRTPARGASIEALRLAVGGLVVTVGLGALLAAAFGWGLPVPVAQLTSVHAAWAIFGWSFTLVIGVSYLTVPMFQLTPPYPKRLSFWLPRALVMGLSVWSAVVLAEGPVALRAASGLLIVACAATYAATTLRLQQKRRRKISDVTMLYFRTAMISMLGAAALAPAIAVAEGELRARFEIAFGIVLLIGFFVSVINGMLYKIVPFINWLHLQKRMAIPPTMNQMIDDEQMRRQLGIHLAALACLVAAVVWPPLAYPAGLLFAVSCGWLEWNIVRAIRLTMRLARAAKGTE